MNVSIPSKPAFGMYEMPVLAFRTDPLAGWPKASTSRKSPSGSLSFSSTGISTMVPSLVEALSSCASGGLFTEEIVTMTVAASVFPLPSETV